MADPKPGYPVTGKFDRQFAQVRIKCPLNPLHGYIEPYEEAWLEHFITKKIADGGHEGNVVPTKQPVLLVDVSQGKKSRESRKYKCRIPGCDAEFATSSQLATHLQSEHACTP